MVVEPAATPVTVRFTVRVLAAMVTVAGTVATDVLSELRVTTTGLRVVAERFRVTVWVVPGPRLMSAGEKLSDAVTLAAPVPDVKPTAAAVTVAFPALRPVTCG